MFLEQEKHLGDFLETIFCELNSHYKSSNNWFLENFSTIKSKDLNCEIVINREFDLKEYGFIDFLLNIGGKYYLIEIKKGKINYQALGQVFRYLKGFKRIRPDVKNSNIKTILIGSGFDNSDVCFIYNDLKNTDVYFYDFDYSIGLILNYQSKDWVISKEV